MKAKTKGIVQIILSILFFLVSSWALLWVLSSSSLAFTACENYSLFHEQIRCRQPNIASILLVLTSIIFITFMVLGVKNIKRDANIA